MVEDRFNHWCSVWDSEFAECCSDDFSFSPIRSEKEIYIVDLRLHCSKQLSEVRADDVEEAELTVESIVGTALLELFDTIHIKKVTVHRTPADNNRDEGGNNGPLSDTCP